MQAKHILLVLVVTYSYDVVMSHIVTSSHQDLPLLACIRKLTHAVRTVLCPTYSDYSAEQADDVLFPREIPWDCCTRACSIGELVSYC